MVKLGAMPAQAIVDRARGSIDFYQHWGVAVARKWPHWPAREPGPDEKITQEVFGYAAKMWKWLPEYLKANYRNMAVGTPVTARDIFMRAYINASQY